MRQRAQMALFLIPAVVIIIIVILLLTLQEPEEAQLLGQINTNLPTNLALFMQQCLKQSVNAAVKEHGFLNNTLVKETVEEEMQQCVDFDVFREQGFAVQGATIFAAVNISDWAVVTSLDYPIVLTKEESTSTAAPIEHVYPRLLMRPVGTPVLVSPDINFEIHIPPGTVATLDGQPVEELGIRLADKHDYWLNNGLLFGMIAYEALPEGVIFSQPVTIIAHYDDEDVPEGIDEEDLTIGYYSWLADVWIGFPTTVDTERNLLTAQTTHFSLYGILLKCTSDEDGTWTTPVLLKEDCEPCEDWSTEPDPQSGGELWILNDEVKKGKGIGDGDTCNGPTTGTRSVTSCADCKGKCTAINGSPIFDCEETFYAYPDKEFSRRIEKQVYFKEAGDACLWSDEGNAEPVIGWIDSTGSHNTDNADIVLEGVCGEDSCEISEVEFSGHTLHFIVEGENSGDDACLSGQVKMTFNGFGIASDDIKFTCEEEGATGNVPIADSGTAELFPAVCVCEGEVCVWEFDEGNSTPMRPKTDKQCPGGDYQHNEYPKCPANFSDTWDGKAVFVGRVLDTRTRNLFCDNYGDFPQMQYKKNMALPQDSELLIMDSAMRNGECWFLVEAQVLLGDYKPDFWVRLEQLLDDGATPLEPTGKVKTAEELPPGEGSGDSCMPVGPAGWREWDYGQRVSYGTHWGIDFFQGEGAPIYAIADGEVAGVGCLHCGLAPGTSWSRATKGFGIAVVVEHNIKGQRLYSLYGHLQGADVSVGQKVNACGQIGRMGHTGYSVGPDGRYKPITHLHLGMSKNNPFRSAAGWVDPNPYLP